MIDFIVHHFQRSISQVRSLDADFIYFAVLCIVAVVVLDAVNMYIRRERKASGFPKARGAIRIEGSKDLPVKTYRSHKLGLSGTPDALVSEGGYIIPVERKPSARKVRDRYVAQLLVYCKLIAEQEKKRPPYGYLILGPECRVHKIPFSKEKEAWLDSIVETMRSCLENGTAVQGTPETKKCLRCDVAAHCSLFNDQA